MEDHTILRKKHQKLFQINHYRRLRRRPPPSLDPPIPLCSKTDPPTPHWHSTSDLAWQSLQTANASHERRHKWHAQFSNDERRVGNLAAGRLRVLAKEASLAGCSRLHLPPGSKTVGFCRSARERSTNSEYKWPRIRGWKMAPRSGPPSGLPLQTISLRRVRHF